MNNYYEQLKQIKEKINNRIKIIKIEFKGLKGEGKLINISPILKEYCKNTNLLPDIEQYCLFDFARIEDEINIYSNTNDKKNENLKELEKCKKIYGEYKKFMDSMKNMDRVLRDRYVIDNLQGLSGIALVYKSELTGIDSLSESIQKKQSLLNIDDLKYMFKFCSECLKDTICRELNQRGEIIGGADEVIKKKIKDMCDFSNVIDKVGIKYNYIFDISEEMLSNEDTIKKLKRKISDDKTRNMIDEYYYIKTNMNEEY